MRTLAACLLLSLVPLPLIADDSPERLVEAGHYKRARVLLEARLKTNPNDAQASYLLSRVKHGFGDRDAALTLAEKAVELDGKNASYHYQLSQVIGDIAQKSSMFKQFGYARPYRSEVEKAISLDPKNLDARVAMLQFYMEAPGIMGGDKSKAKATAEEIGRMDASRGYLAQALIVEREKDNTSRLEDLYQKAAAANPASYRAHVLLANLYLSPSVKKYDLAETHSREALNLEPGRFGPYALLAVRYALDHRWSELDTVLAQAEKNVPDNLSPYFQAARVLITDGKDLPCAERYLRKYLTQEPEATAPAPALARAHWRLGQALEKQGRKPEAVTEVEMAVRMDPKFEPASKDLKRMKG